MGSFAQLNYSNVHDFTVFEDITITKMNISKPSSIPDIQDFTDTTVVNLNKKLTEISLEYPWELPFWSKIVITVVLTLVVIAVFATCCMCHHHGKCQIEQYLFSKGHIKPEQISHHSMTHDLPCTTSEKSMPIPNFKPTNSHLIEDGQSFELQPLNKPKSLK